MQAYCDDKTIYFQIQSSIGFAGMESGGIISGNYQGGLPFKYQKLPYSTQLKTNHSAEHKVYNAFINNLKNKKNNLGLSELIKHLPTLEQIKKTDDFSFFCGSTYYLGSGLLLLIAALPNIFHFHNQNLLFMPAWMVGSLMITYLVMKITQKQFFLAQAGEAEINLALTAIKEAFKHARNNQLQY